MQNMEGLTIFIRNMEASLLYKMGVEQNPEHRKLINEYVDLCNQKNYLNREIKEIKEASKKNEIKVEIKEQSQKKSKIENEIIMKSPGVFKLDDKNTVNLKGKDNRYYYKGNLTDSLMRRELEKNLLKGDKFDVSGTCGFSDVIINISFSKDYMILDSKNDNYYRKLINRKKLREIFYRDGIWINGSHYVEYQRSGSKARTGNCLFIKEIYAGHMQSWQRLGLNFKKEIFKKSGDSYKTPQYIKIDITGLRAYESLTSSSIIGTVDIDPYSILLIDDVKGSYTMECNVVNSYETTVKNKDKESVDYELGVNKELYTQETDLWDGQSLLDESVFNTTYTTYNKKHEKVKHSFKGKGFLLLRNHFLKSAGFSTRLQEWYKSDEAKRTLTYDEESGMWYALDRFNNKMDTKNIMMVTTKNSIKIFKEPFMTCILQDELNLTPDDIEKISQLERESLVWGWYRHKIKEGMGSTVGVCKYEKMSKFQNGLYQQMGYQMLNSLNLSYEDLENLSKEQVNEIMLMKNYLAFFKDSVDTRGKNSAKQSMMLALLEVNEDVQATQLFKDYRDEQLKHLRRRMEDGKILTRDSDYCILFGNPYEMLQASANGLDSEDGFAKSSIMYNEEHDKKNQFEVYTPKYDSKKELFGFRSPHICEGNCALLINTYHSEYKWFNLTDNVITVSFWGYGAFLSPKLNGADVDSDSILVGDNPIILKNVIKAQSKPIPINGLTPQAVKLSFTEENLSETDCRLANDYIGRICNLAQNLQSYYWHICNSGTSEQKEKYLDKLYDDICVLEVLSNVAIDSAKREYPINIGREINRILQRDYFFEKGAVIDGDSIAFVVEKGSEAKTYYKKPKFMLKNRRTKQFKVQKDATEEQKKSIEWRKNDEKELSKRMFITFDTPMDIIKKVLDKNIKRTANSISPIPITNILKPIKSGEKADYNRTKNIIKSAIEYGKELNEIQNRYGSNTIGTEQLYSEKLVVESKAIEEYSKIRLTANDIIVLLRKVYEVRDKYDTNGKLIKKNGIDQRDKTLLESRMGSRMLQWLYQAHEEIFLSAIKEGGKGTISSVLKIPKDYVPENGVNVKIFEKYGEHYIIVKEVPEDCHTEDKQTKIYNICGKYITVVEDRENQKGEARDIVAKSRS